MEAPARLAGCSGWRQVGAVTVVHDDLGAVVDVSQSGGAILGQNGAGVGRQGALGYIVDNGVGHARSGGTDQLHSAIVVGEHLVQSITLIGFRCKLLLEETRASPRNAEGLPRSLPE